MGLRNNQRWDYEIIKDGTIKLSKMGLRNYQIWDYEIIKDGTTKNERRDSEKIKNGTTK